MSYILDALRKSENERRQGRIPDLGSSVQMVHKPRRRSIHWSVWITLALLINAAVVTLVFWPKHSTRAVARTSPAGSQPGKSTKNTKNRVDTLPVESATKTRVNAEADSVATEPRVTGSSVRQTPTSQPESAHSTKPSAEVAQEAPSGKTQVQNAKAVTQARQAKTANASAGIKVPKGATLIRPHRASASANSAPPGNSQQQTLSEAKVPALGDMPDRFQRQVPDLHFNGHIYSSNPSARRVMINDIYLAQGDSYKGMRIDRITPQGVIMSRDGRAFRVSFAHDWNQPD